MRIVRILRGIVTSAVTWAGLWMPSALIPIGMAALTGNPLPLSVVGAILVSQGLIGAVNGVVFATVLAIAGRRKTFESLSMPLMAACGAVGGVLFPVVVRTVMLSTLGIQIMPTALIFLVINALLGAGCAALTLHIARRAPALQAGSDSAMPEVEARAQLRGQSQPKT